MKDLSKTIRCHFGGDWWQALWLIEKFVSYTH